METIPHPELEARRTDFPILGHSTYLNSCSLGALSLRSQERLAEYQALWDGRGASAWYGPWLETLDRLRRGVAVEWNARETELALLPSVSAALTMIASAVDHSTRPRVVVSELDFPTIAYQWLARPDVEVVQVPSDDGIGVSLERWREAVDGRTAVVATSHVFYSTGYIQDLGALAELARAAGALFVVDGYQAAGQLPVDPRASGADVYVAGPLKWMLGGPGLAYLWVREERLAELVPRAASWFGVSNQFDFDARELRLRDDARRFELGTPAMPTAYTALGGLEVLGEAGINRVRDRVAALTADLIERARAAGFGVLAAERPERRSAIVMIDAGDAGSVVDALAERRIIVDARGRYIRVSPHFYNTAAENAHLVESLVELSGVGGGVG